MVIQKISPNQTNFSLSNVNPVGVMQTYDVVEYYSCLSCINSFTITEIMCLITYVRSLYTIF